MVAAAAQGDAERGGSGRGAGGAGPERSSAKLLFGWSNRRHFIIIITIIKHFIMRVMKRRAPGRASAGAAGAIYNYKAVIIISVIIIKRHFIIQSAIF